MKKIFFTALCFYLFLISFINIKTNYNKQNLLFALDNYSLLIRKDLLDTGGISAITKLLLDKDKIQYEVEEQKENENIKFSLSSYYFNYLQNKELEITISYLVIS